MAALVFFMVLIVSGLALNHGRELGLDEAQWRTPWLLDWYGIHSAAPEQGYAVGKGLIAAAGGVWVMDGRPLAEVSGEMIGAIEAGGMRYLAAPDHLYVYAPDGKLVDHLDAAALPGKPVQRIGERGARLVIEAGGRTFSSADALEWKPENAAGVRWASGVALDPAIRTAWEPAFRPSITPLRVLQDLHSGRILGRYGPFLMDLTAAALAALLITGVWMVWRTSRVRN